jgi:hypothetical protein
MAGPAATVGRPDAVSDRERRQQRDQREQRAADAAHGYRR